MPRLSPPTAAGIAAQAALMNNSSLGTHGTRLWEKRRSTTVSLRCVWELPRGQGVAWVADCWTAHRSSNVRRRGGQGAAPVGAGCPSHLSLCAAGLPLQGLTYSHTNKHFYALEEVYDDGAWGLAQLACCAQLAWHTHSRGTASRHSLLLACPDERAAAARTLTAWRLAGLLHPPPLHVVGGRCCRCRCCCCRCC